MVSARTGINCPKQSAVVDPPAVEAQQRGKAAGVLKETPASAGAGLPSGAHAPEPAGTAGVDY